ncbi:MAG TPA: Flp family type IVb pilin [Acidimicrobiia bacterium]|nr:Flp family type IVb pilin [Acidimicrobiia bacterium]
MYQLSRRDRAPYFSRHHRRSRRLGGDQGASMVEYALALVLIAMISFGALAVLGGETSDTFGSAAAGFGGAAGTDTTAGPTTTMAPTTTAPTTTSPPTTPPPNCSGPPTQRPPGCSPGGGAPCSGPPSQRPPGC